MINLTAQTLEILDSIKFKSGLCVSPDCQNEQLEGQIVCASCYTKLPESLRSRVWGASNKKNSWNYIKDVSSVLESLRKG